MNSGTALEKNAAVIKAVIKFDLNRIKCRISDIEGRGKEGRSTLPVFSSGASILAAKKIYPCSRL
jgi:hypothetical protein